MITEAKLAKNGDGRVVVAEVRSPEAGRLEPGPLEYADSPRDGLALRRVIEKRVVAVYEAVDGELSPAVGVAPEQIGMTCEHARRRRPRGTRAETRGDGAVALEAGGHRRRGGAEA